MKAKILALVAIGLTAASCRAAEPAVVRDRENVETEDVVAHDPVIIEEGDTYYLFTTGPGVSVWSSSDRERWTMQKPVFDPVPDWTYETVSGFNGHMWAPDISLRDGTYYLYYSVSSFGTNDSCIGLATNVTLDRESEDFEWVDRGIVLRSEPGIDNWNAIDPNLAFDGDGNPYLAFGSFWSGLKLAEMNEELDGLANPEEEPVAIASRVSVPDRSPDPGEAPLRAGNGAIEGPFIYQRNGYYYLFASIDYCCRGKDSTYKMIFGRSKAIDGPYLDQEGNKLLEGGGTILMRGDERWHGVGHNSVCLLDGEAYVVFHGYDGDTERGLPKLRIEKLGWSEANWPYIIESD